MHLDSHNDEKFLKKHNIEYAMTICCKLNTIVDLEKFSEHVLLLNDGIVCVKYGDPSDPATNRSIINTIKNKTTRFFYNQATVLIKPKNDNPQAKYIQIKIFKNGSVQMCGCKSFDDFYDVVSTLINVLKAGNNSGIDFITNYEDIGIYDIITPMIIANYSLGFQINVDNLLKLLKQNHDSTTTDTDIGYVKLIDKLFVGSRCNIEYDNDNNKIKIIVYREKIFIWAKSLDEIVAAYNYINMILAKYINEINVIG